MNPTLLRDYQGQDVSGWLMSEKLDGWRMMWNGSEFVSRQGVVFDAPEWFKKGMPTMALDGELFAGRGEFNAIQRRMSEGWLGLTFEVFDVPEMVAPFRQRAKYLQYITLPSHVSLVRHERCRDMQHMLVAAEAVIDEGGEGVVVRDPKAMYEAGRTADVLRWVPQDPAVNRRKSA